MFSDTKSHPSPSRSTAGEGRPPPPVGIALMGATGGGKSSFINAASDSQLRVGNELTSCTTDVQLSQEFIVDGRRVFLIDTPGFDDTNVSDAETLKRIAAFLAVTYEKGYKLAGILYVHRISDLRFTGASARNFRMFQQLCGKSAMKNVIFMTNMWGRVEKHIEERHEKELFDTHFKPALDQGAQTARHYNTTQSAHEIIRRIIKNDPVPLLIQQELVDEHKDIEKTSAGEAVNEELNKTIKRHEAEMVELREDMRKALEEKDEEAAKEMREEADKLRKQMEWMKAEGATMGAKYGEERKRMETAMAAKHQEERKRAEAATLGAKYDEERKKMEAAMEAKYEEEWKRLDAGTKMEERGKMETIIAAKFEEERKRIETVIAAKYDEERKRSEQAMQRAQQQALQERQKAHNEYTKQINELRAKLEENANASAGEREKLLRRIHELECRQPNTSPKRSGICVVI